MKLSINVFDDFDKYSKRMMRYRIADQSGGLLAWFYLVHLFSKRDKYKNNSVYNDHMLKILRHSIGAMNDDEQDKVLITGDFNINPFEAQLYINVINKDEGFLSIPIRRAFDKQKYDKYYYNPTWLLGNDITQNNVGYTYYHPTTGDNEKHFNLLDGVLLRKGLVTPFQVEKFKILHQYGCSSLLGKGELVINSKLYSDHLPIIFVLRFSEDERKRKTRRSRTT